MLTGLRELPTQDCSSPAALSAPVSIGEFGILRFTEMPKLSFQISCSQPPPDDESKPPTAGSMTNIGTLALFLFSNWCFEFARSIDVSLRH